jgi:asparagine synthase (glutamine-hydrolysing)
MVALCEIAQVAICNERKHLEGAVIEAGCALGGSAIILAAAKSKDRMLLVYDVFDVHPPPSNKNGSVAHEVCELIAAGKAQGIGGDLYYGYEKNLYDKVLQSFGRFGLEPEGNNVYLRKGLFEDTLIVQSPVSLAHIDCDWHDSVLTCLNRIEPCLVKGGTLIVNDHWSGSAKAVQRYFENKDRNDYNFARKTALYIVKK